MSEDKFKLPQSSYEELTKVIKAYGHFSKPTGLNEVSKFIGLHTTVISRNAGFLIAVGILESGGKKEPTSTGRELARALEHNMPDEIRTWWQQIVLGNDFLTRLLSAIKIRNGMDQQTLEAHIAYSAGQPKKSQFMTGARTVIDILKAAELIVERDGKYIAEAVRSGEYETAPTEVTVDTAKSQAEPVQQRRLTVPVAITRSQTEAAGAVQITVQVNINCTPADIDGLGERLRRMIKEVSGGSRQDDDTEYEDK